VTSSAAPEVRGACFSGGRRSFNASTAHVRAVAVLAAVFFSSTCSYGTSDGLTAASGPKPAFALVDTTGRDLALSALAGRDVVVHFFATWCAPCREELAALNRLAARARDQNLVIVAIPVGEVPIRVKRFLTDTPVKFPVPLDAERATAKAWGVSTLLTTFVLDRALKTRLVVVHDHHLDQFDPAKAGNHSLREDKR